MEKGRSDHSGIRHHQIYVGSQPGRNSGLRLPSRSAMVKYDGQVSLRFIALLRSAFRKLCWQKGFPSPA